MKISIYDTQYFAMTDCEFVTVIPKRHLDIKVGDYLEIEMCRCHTWDGEVTNVHETNMHDVIIQAIETSIVSCSS